MTALRKIKTSLNRLLIAQMIYAFIGIMYNVASLLDQRTGLASWASTDAVVGVAGMALYGLFLSTGLMRNLRFYRILMTLSVVLLGYNGVITHILNVEQLDLYQSVWVWGLAIAINLCGLILNVFAALGWFSTTSKH